MVSLLYRILKNKIFFDLILSESSSWTDTYVKYLHSDKKMEVAEFVLLVWNVNEKSMEHQERGAGMIF